MGATSCKCNGCDSNAGANDGTAVVQASAYAEEVEEKMPKIVDTAMPDTRPPEQTGGPPEDASPSAAMPDSELKELEFQLEAGRSLNVRFIEVTEPASTGGTLMIATVDPQAVLATTKAGVMGLCRGDMVVKVNGKAGSKKQLLELLRKGKEAGGLLTVHVRPRPAKFEVTLHKEGEEKLGIVVAVHDEIEDKVEIRQVSDTGAVPAWNDKNYMNQVVSGDWIVEVNDQASSCKSMVSALQESWKNSQPVSIKVVSSPTPEEREQKPAA